MNEQEPQDSFEPLMVPEGTTETEISHGQLRRIIKQIKRRAIRSDENARAKAKNRKRNKMAKASKRKNR